MIMSAFDERENAFEQQFLHDREMHFRVVAHRNKLLGLWAARLIGLREKAAEIYAMSVVDCAIVGRGDEVVAQKLIKDLARSPKPVSEHEVRTQMKIFDAQARADIMGKTSRPPVIELDQG